MRRIAIYPSCSPICSTYQPRIPTSWTFLCAECASSLPSRPDSAAYARHSLAMSVPKQKAVRYVPTARRTDSCKAYLVLQICLKQMLPTWLRKFPSFAPTVVGKGILNFKRSRCMHSCFVMVNQWSLNVNSLAESISCRTRSSSRGMNSR